jgi:hypothetical protein
MERVVKHRVALLCTLLVVGVVVGAAIVVLGAEKAIPGMSTEYISVVKPQQMGEPPNQQALLQALYHERVQNLTAIANKDERVQALLAGKNYTVVAVVVDRAPPTSSSDPPIQNASLVLKLESKFYKIDIDIPHEKVTSVAERTCYGPACND